MEAAGEHSMNKEVADPHYIRLPIPVLYAEAIMMHHAVSFITIQDKKKPTYYSNSLCTQTCFF